MGRGRKPEDPQVLQLRGGFRPARHGAKGLILPASTPAKPAWLNAEAASCWDRIVPELYRAGVLTQLDSMVLVLYVTAWSDFRKASALIESEGHVSTTAAGNPKTHPAVGVRDIAFRQLLLAGEKLGLSPTSRRNLKPSAPPSEDATKTKFFKS